VVSVVYLDGGCRTHGCVLFVKKERKKEREKKRVEIRRVLVLVAETESEEYDVEVLVINGFDLRPSVLTLCPQNLSFCMQHFAFPLLPLFFMPLTNNSPIHLLITSLFSSHSPTQVF